MTFETWFQQQQPHIPHQAALTVARLADEGATVPFLARYRKDQTGGLNEVDIQHVLDAQEKWKLIANRKKNILAAVEAQQKLTDELSKKIADTYSLQDLEDLYLPYRQKKATKAATAREAGLEPLAQLLWDLGAGSATGSLADKATGYLNAEKGISDSSKALEGARDIVVEWLSDRADLRAHVRKSMRNEGAIYAKATEKAKKPSKYEKFFDYYENVESLLKPANSHRYLALRRGVTEHELKLTMTGGKDNTEWDAKLVKLFEGAASQIEHAEATPILHEAGRIALRQHVFPAIDREIHKSIKEVADAVAIRVFAENVRKLLLAPPFGPRAVLGVDPGFKSGCKLAAVDGTGKFLGHHLLYLETPEQKQAAKTLIAEAHKTFPYEVVAVGNGTGGREAEQFFRETLKEAQIEVPVVLVNEAGASVYSASEAAREEFPELDITVRGAISIARRLQDPLAELVKIDPRSIGVGQYQHDVAPGTLRKSLANVVDWCVNSVGVNLNTASYFLLAHVSGIGEAIAKNLVQQREEKGLFKTREELKAVAAFNEKTFELAAGFLRIPESENLLDRTAVHPESYEALSKVLLADSDPSETKQPIVTQVSEEQIALLKASEELKATLGQYSLSDIVTELQKPGRDPRPRFELFHYRDDIHKIEDLKPGLDCPGVVTNVTNFGAFVDIGVHQDGLVHLSQLCNRFVRDPREVVNPGDRVKVRVLEVDLEKRQIALTMKSESDARPAARRRPRPDKQGAANKGKRPEKSGGKSNRPGQKPNRQGGGKKPSRPNHQAVLSHNPFGALAALKQKD